MNEQVLPDETWSLDQLGSFCRERSERMAMDAWLVGKAMVLAKERVRLECASFTKWKRLHGFSDPTASRYMRLYKSYPSEDDRKRLSTLGIMEALREAGITKTSSTTTTRDEGDVDMMFGDENSAAANRPPQPTSIAPRQTDIEAEPDKSATKPAAKPTGKTVPSVFSWAVSTKDNLAGDSADDEPPFEDSWHDCESLDEELRIIIPMHLLQVRGELQRVLDRDVNEVRKAWPADSLCRLQLMTEINRLAALLLRLFDTRPIEDEELAKSA